MRKILYLLGLIAFAMPVLASDPYAGTWKLNAAKTKYTSGIAPKEVTLEIIQQGDNLMVSVAGIDGSGSPIAVKYAVPVSGGIGTVQQGQFDTVVSKRVDANTRETSFMKDGKEIRARRAVISEDGKTMTSAVSGIDFVGNPVVGTEVFEKKE